MWAPKEEQPKEEQLEGAVPKPHDQFFAYMRGWTAGAGVKRRSPVYTEHPDTRIRELYDRGYIEGNESRRETSRKAQIEFGFTPSVLRLQVEEDER